MFVSPTRRLVTKFRAAAIAVTALGALAATGVSAAVTPDSASQPLAACQAMRCK